MKVMRKCFFGKAVSVFALMMFVMTMNGSMGYAAAPAIKVKHDILAYFVPEKRIMMEATITQGLSDVKLVRCYFRSTEHADYVFVDMTAGKNGVYKGILPAPTKETQMIEYLFVVADKKNQPIKTQLFGVKKQDGKETPEWQQVSSEGNIQVSTELAAAPKSVSGFSDSITMNVVESSTRFGVVAGGGIGAYTWLGVGAAVAADGGIVAASGGGGGDPILPTPDKISTWTFSSRCANLQDTPVTTFDVQINETKGGAVIGDGIGPSGDSSIRIVLNGKYDAAKRTFSGNIVTTTTKLPYTCVRTDEIIPFDIPSGSNDTGYKDTTEVIPTSCGTSDLGCRSG